MEVPKHRHQGVVFITRRGDTNIIISLNLNHCITTDNLRKTATKTSHLFSRKLSAWRTKAICISTEVRLFRVSLAGTSNTSVICFTISHMSDTFCRGERGPQPVTWGTGGMSSGRVEVSGVFVEDKIFRSEKQHFTQITLSSRLSATEAHKSPRFGWMWPFTIFSLKT